MNNLLELLAASAARFPDKTAVACREESYTFSECLMIASRLGRTIAGAVSRAGRENGPQPVAVLVSRDAAAVPLFLSVLYSGHFYAALDPEMPAARLAAILKDADPPVVLTSDEHLDRLKAAGYTGIVLGIHDLAEDPLPLPEISGDAPAYMVYTSGSTGVPKGVLKSHGAVLNFIQGYADFFHLGSDEIIGNQTPLYFDASAKDVYLMLAAGATLEILPSELFILPVTLIRYLNERKVTYLCWVPTALALVTQLGTFREVMPETVRKVFFVGEVFPMKQLRKWMAALPDLTYVNLYGSTEQAGVCCFQVLDESCLEEDTLPMGRPLPGNQIYLLGENGWVSEPETTGEVIVVNDSLAMEYYHDPEKTASTFYTAELPDGTRRRVLKSGDLARFDAEGRLHFVSRSDTQIKHMGRRIELGEIETAADLLPDIARCCCLYDPAKKAIVLFAELTEGSTASGRELRSALKAHLAEYMVPARVEVLPALPLMANSKINRQKLKEMLTAGRR